jgi:hypothetical protein
MAVILTEAQLRDIAMRAAQKGADAHGDRNAACRSLDEKRKATAAGVEVVVQDAIANPMLPSVADLRDRALAAVAAALAAVDLERETSGSVHLGLASSAVTKFAAAARDLTEIAAVTHVHDAAAPAGADTFTATAVWNASQDIGLSAGQGDALLAALRADQ